MGVGYLNPNVHKTQSDATCRNKIRTRLLPREGEYIATPTPRPSSTPKHKPLGESDGLGRGEAVGVQESERVVAGRVRGPPESKIQMLRGGWGGAA